MHFVYILECADKSLYIGCTNNLERRVKQHNNSKWGAHYTKIRRPVVLKFTESFATLREARSREAEIKRWRREEKLALVNSVEKKNKVLVYVVRDGKLLVFSHSDFPEAGIQVPAGTVREGENIENAAKRELIEETGNDCFRIVKYLGVVSDYFHADNKEIHTRHFFQAEPTDTLPDRWVALEKHDGLQEPTRFEFFWLPLSEGHRLIADQNALLVEIK